MSKRWTFMVVDQDTGKQYIGVHSNCPHIHNDKDIIELFIKENNEYKECEVIKG